jgi:hypothetical protein
MIMPKAMFVVESLGARGSSMRLAFSAAYTLSLYCLSCRSLVMGKNPWICDLEVFLGRIELSCDHVSCSNSSTYS